MFSRRLQVQERLTMEIAEFLQETLQPQGVAVVIDGAHMCAMMRGVKKSETAMTTTTMLGEFKDNRDLREELLAHLSRPRHDD
jgi:GTP cyclohydrolase I